MKAEKIPNLVTMEMDGTVASKPANAVLELNNISRRFGITDALRDVSLAIVPGEIICLVGQSGCGKSSLLRIIAGVDMPDSGVLMLKDEEIAGPRRFVEPEARNIGFVFQDYALFPHLTAEQNVLFGLKGMPKKQARERAAEMIDRVGLYPLMKRYPHMLSGGEQQRVALARALAPNPNILLMDEPFSSLDRGLREKVRDETLALLRALGTTVIMVTHDPEEALSAGDRIVLMRKGKWCRPVPATISMIGPIVRMQRISSAPSTRSLASTSMVTSKPSLASLRARLLWKKDSAAIGLSSSTGYLGGRSQW